MALYLLPVVFFIPWPTNPLFYIFLLAQAPLAVYQDKKTFDLTASHGGGAITRIEPLSIVLLFFLWLCLSPIALQNNLEAPINFILISLVICAVAFFATRLKKCEVNASILKEMMPLILAAALVSVLAKSSIDTAAYDSAIFVYVFVQSIMMLCVAILFNKKATETNGIDIFSKKQILCSFFLSIIILVTVLSRIYAFKYVDNPAYVSAIVLTSPFWVMLFYKFVKHEEKGDIKSGVAIVLCTVLLTLLVIK